MLKNEKYWQKKKISTPYEFGYEIHDQNGNKQHRHESSDEDGVRRGSYGYVDANGVYRKVEYIADKNGFRVKEMKSNEPGFDSKEKPADVVKLKHVPEPSNLVTSSNNKIKALKLSPKEREANNYKVSATMKHRPVKSESSNDTFGAYRPISSFIESPKFKSAGHSDPREYDSYVSHKASSNGDTPGQSSYTVPIYQDVKGGRKTIQHVPVEYPTKTVQLVDYSKKGKPSGSGEYLNEPIDGYTLLKAIESKPSKTNDLDRYQKYQNFDPVRINSRPPISSEYQHPIAPQYVPVQPYEVHRYPTTQKPTYPPTTTSYPTYQTNQYPTTQYPQSNTYPPTTQYPTTQYPTTQYPTTQYPTTQYPTTQYPTTNYPPNQYSTTNQYPSTSPYLPPPPYMNTYSDPSPPPTIRPAYTRSPTSPSYSPTPYPYDSVPVHPYPDSYSPSTVRKQMVPSVFYADESSGIDNRYPQIEPVDSSSYFSPSRSGVREGGNGGREASLPSLPFSEYPRSPGSPRRGSWYDAVRSSRPSTLTTPSDTIPSVILGIQVALQAHNGKNVGESGVSSASSWNATSSLPSYDSDSYNPSHYPSHHQIMLLRRGLGKLIPLLHKKDSSNSLSKNSSRLNGSASDQNSIIKSLDNDLEPSASKKYTRDSLPVYKD